VTVVSLFAGLDEAVARHPSSQKHLRRVAPRRVAGGEVLQGEGGPAPSVARFGGATALHPKGSTGEAGVPPSPVSPVRVEVAS
jgi:hypothetical protein